MKLTFVFDRNPLKRGNKVGVFFLAVLFLMSSCASVEGVKKDRGKGVSKQYNRPYRKVYVACLDSMHKLNIAIVEKDKETGVIVGKKDPHPVTLGTGALACGLPLIFGTSGEIVAIYVERIDNNSTSVEVVSRRKVETAVFSKDWTNKLFLAIERSFKTPTSKGVGMWSADQDPQPAPPSSPTITRSAKASGRVYHLHNSHIFHRDSCGVIQGESTLGEFSSRDKAIKAGAVPCKSCNP